VARGRILRHCPPKRAPACSWLRTFISLTLLNHQGSMTLSRSLQAGHRTVLRRSVKLPPSRRPRVWAEDRGQVAAVRDADSPVCNLYVKEPNSKCSVSIFSQRLPFLMSQILPWLLNLAWVGPCMTGMPMIASWWHGGKLVAIFRDAAARPGACLCRQDRLPKSGWRRPGSIRKILKSGSPVLFFNRNRPTGSLSALFSRRHVARSLFWPFQFST
jgi:hypothetical protein